MKTLIIAALAGALASTSCLAALGEGELAPLFKAPAALDGKPLEYSLADALQHGPVVVYFYPSSFTQGCNLQAHTFATRLDRFTAAGATVVGVSLDDQGRLLEFSAAPDYCAGKLPVVSDVDGRIAAAYALKVREAPDEARDTRGEAIHHGLSERTTFVIGRDGRIVATLGGLAPVANVQRALETVEHLSGKARD